MATSTVPQFRSDLAADIVAQLTSDAVTGVTTTEFPPGDEMAQTDAVYIGKVSTVQDHLAFGGSRAEDLTAEVFVFVLTPGAGDTAAATSEDRAHTILASIETAVRDDATVSASTWHAQLAGHESENGVTPDGRFCLITATVEAESHI